MGLWLVFFIFFIGICAYLLWKLRQKDKIHETRLIAKDAELQEKDSELQEKDSELQEKDSKLQEKETALQGQIEQLKEEKESFEAKYTQKSHGS